MVIHEKIISHYQSQFIKDMIFNIVIIKKSTNLLYIHNDL